MIISEGCEVSLAISKYSNLLYNDTEIIQSPKISELLKVSLAISNILFLLRKSRNFLIFVYRRNGPVSL